ncbi:MAG: hypothetical protein QXU82_03530 [Candidatus Aenigmatarchaeota archaeon]
MKRMMPGENLKGEIMLFFHKRLPIFVSLPVVVFGMLYYRHISILLVGGLAMLLDLGWECYLTKKGLWSYKRSRFFMIFGRIPLEVPLIYFFVGAAVSIYILFRLGYVPGA